MPASQPANFNLQEFTDVGKLLVGGRLYTYAYGTTAQKIAYTDPDGTVPHTYTPDGIGGQYIALNARGELPAPLYLGEGSYDIALKRDDGSTVWTRKADGVENSVKAWIAALSGALGASRIGFQQDAGAQPHTVQDALRSAFSISYSNYMTDQELASVLAGADATLFLQAAISALPAGGRLHGSGATFTVTSLYLKSKMTVSNFNLKTKGGTADFVSPITIDGRAAAKTDIFLIDINIDGNRINQLDIVSPGEDGGRHGIRMIGRCSDIYLERVTANYCAGDGIEMYSSTSASGDDNDYVFNNINLRDCVFHWNRRHGMSGDSVKSVHLSNVRLEHNGLDLNTVDPLTSGGRGARQGGSLYGNGIDFEGYGLGSGLKHVTLDRVFGLYNARGGALFLDALGTRGAGFVPRGKIWITDCYFDEGLDVSRSGEALTFTSTIASKALGALYDSVYISNTRLDGHLIARSVNNLMFDGDINTSSGPSLALLDYATNIVIDAVPSGSGKRVEAYDSTYSLGRETIPTPAAPVLTYDSGPGGVLSNIVYKTLENVRDRTCRFLITARWHANAAGIPVFYITPAAGSSISAPPRVDVVSAATGLAIPTVYSMSIASFRFSDPATADQLLQIVVDVKV
jgi:hypothetical protein